MPALVIDHESADATAAIAQQHGARVITRPFEGFVNARRFALAHVQTPWTLMIDADERLDDRLRRAILDADDRAQGYEVSRTTLYCGKALRMWRDERILRLFRTGAATLQARPAAGGAAQLHERWEIDGRVTLLDGTLIHESYPCAQAYVEKFAEYTRIEAAGIRGSLCACALELLKTPVRFAWYGLVRGAVLDGTAGLRVAWFSAFYPAAVQLHALRSGAGSP